MGERHGQAKNNLFTKKYKTWRAVKQRCLDPNHKNADVYNGLLFKDWEIFENFDRDIPEPPSDNHTIDRIDNNKGYEPGNVRWATITEQHRNQSNCRWIEFNGKNQLLSDWATELNITPSALIGRIDRHGIELALTVEKGKKIAIPYNKQFITKDGITDSVKGWSERLGRSEWSIRQGIKDHEFSK